MKDHEKARLVNYITYELKNRQPSIGLENLGCLRNIISRIVNNFFDKWFGELADIHAKSIRNRDSIENSHKCGCFYCQTVFTPEKINEWCDDSNTAICPFCGIDSVICDYDCDKLNKDLLRQLEERYFGEYSNLHSTD